MLRNGGVQSKRARYSDEVQCQTRKIFLQIPGTIYVRVNVVDKHTGRPVRENSVFSFLFISEDRCVSGKKVADQIDSSRSL